jgi:hypothetical protein
VTFLHILQKWGGEPFPAEGMVEGYWRGRVGYPSTMLRMVPLPTPDQVGGREELR